jgi:tetratricopeptide (TPR) repeat protein
MNLLSVNLLIVSINHTECQKFLFSFPLPSSLSFYLHNMDCCARLNNVGASQLVNGRYANAINSFTRSLSLAKSAIAVLVAENQAKHMNNCTSHSLQPQRRCAVVLFKYSAASVAAPEAKVQPVVDDRHNDALRGLYMFPLDLSESAEYQHYDPTVEASIAIMFNLALAHHLSALYGPFNRCACTLEQAIDLYELAYTVQMQEDAKLSIELTMAIINNLGHIHRLLGDEDKGGQCFRHLLSTIFFFRSYGERHINSVCCHTDTFVYSVSYLILRKTVAGAA